MARRGGLLLQDAAQRHKDMFMSQFDPDLVRHPDLDGTLAALRALAEETRLRVLVLLAEGELSVSDLTEILSQSQPRISRHLKVLVESGLVERHREGAWAFFRLADRGAARLVAPLLASLDRNDRRLAEDLERLAAVREQRDRAAQAFFARLAPQWDSVRSLHISEEAVEAAILDVVAPRPDETLVDLGTGTGRVLQILTPKVARAVGLDASHAMLSVARANLERAGIGRVELRQGDIYAPPFARGLFDIVIIHQVLHYLDDPSRAISQAARLVAPGGRLLVVDFAPHRLDFLREESGHRRLGFAADQVSGWLNDAGLVPRLTRDLAPPSDDRDGLTVSLWLADSKQNGANALVPTEKEWEIA
jgi:ubiquinone/menaquinone biosynthesis C-methylase UbiE/DNA-binding transcriptional ArsR family regulator